MNRTTRTDDITCVLRDEVLRGQYRAGERLPSERELAARFDTTRAVARIALKKLEQMGVAEIQPGGARVQPLDESNLEVIGHLLEMDGRPDPELVDQVLEVVGALIAANMRMTLERAQPAQLERVHKLIDELQRGDLTEAEYDGLLHEFAHAFMEATDNVVMKMVRRALRTSLFTRLDQLGVGLGSREFDAQGREVGNAMPRPDITPHVKDIAKALENRDGLAGYEAIHRMWTLFRARVRASLEADGESEKPTSQSAGGAS